ncbi:sugar porter family MFS transporter [Pelagicoccus sp. SDUM812005]|uniref:sugar porter family MFS transporter n=1 Tax=Pelagicoccus sp. SDUM812005 TaxID=3041257 RepID=UPI00280E1B13|nr:sugar porter family MFS transporter [Pelagicoccus sp. SDUM812005]MDQ8183129.1 sugar porter family MFS transporter [Pelagicoccus sp. SDUM812005]
MQTNHNFNGKYIFCISLVAAMGGLLFGYDWVVIGGARAFYEPFFGLTGEENAWMAGWAAGSALLGCLAGAILSGAITDRLGRKRILILAAVMFTASAVWTALAGSLTGFVLARILGGVGIGLASNVSPMYIAEVSPSSMRGRFVSINQLTIVIGVLAAQLVNLAIYNYAPIDTAATAATILESWNGQQGWRWMFAAEALPAAGFLVLAFFIPESPRWLIKKNRRSEAATVLEKIGGKAYADFEVDDIGQTLSKDTDRFRLRELLQKKLFGVVLLGVFIAMFQQWCGINTIFYYASEVFASAGYDLSDQMTNIVWTGGVNLVFTFVAIFVVDKLGRRPLMLFGAGGLAVIYAIMGALYLFEVEGAFVLVIVLAAIACYAMTLAPITWVLLSEIFPNRVRGAAMAVCVSSLWIANFLLVQTFPPINAALGASGTFWLYGIICAVGFFVFALKVPETKGKSLEDIERELTSQN